MVAQRWDSSTCQNIGPAGGHYRTVLDSLPIQAEMLAEAGVDLIALEMIGARGYGRAALQVAAESPDPPQVHRDIQAAAYAALT